MSKPAPIMPDEFVSSQGHTFKPGDRVIAVTMCTARASLQHGTYEGVRYYSGYYDRERNPKGRPQVVLTVVKSTKKFVHKETGAEYDWKSEWKELPYPSSPRWTNDSMAYDAALEVYKKARDEYNKTVAERRKDYEYRDFQFLGRTMLQLNKVYPADIALRDVKL